MIARPHVDRYLDTKKRRRLSGLLRTRTWQNLIQQLRPAVQNPAGGPNDAKIIYRLGQQVIYAGLGLGMSFLSAYLYLGGADLWAERGMYGAAVGLNLFLRKM